MHLKRVPVEPTPRALFIGAYVIQGLATIAVAGFAFTLSYSQGGSYLQILLQGDVELMWVLSGFAVLLVWLSWLDEGLELALQDSGDGKENGKDSFLVSPFGFWWCLHPEVTPEEILAEEVATTNALSHSLSASKRGRNSGPRLSEFSPLLGESVAQMKLSATDLSNV
jgi:hypothetical protein